jgi:hypothetical protein
VNFSFSKNMNPVPTYVFTVTAARAWSSIIKKKIIFGQGSRPKPPQNMGTGSNSYKVQDPVGFGPFCRINIQYNLAPYCYCIYGKVDFNHVILMWL